MFAFIVHHDLAMSGSPKFPFTNYLPL